MTGYRSFMTNPIAKKMVNAVKFVNIAFFSVSNREPQNDETSVSQELLREYNSSRPLGPRKTFCYAPKKSLYFTPDGKVYSCCYNRDFVLGSYPEQSIGEIWKGNNITQLRDALKSNNLSLGCYSCQTQLEEGTFDSVLAKYFDVLPKRKYPTLMEFELSNVCNLACVMCDGRYSSVIRREREKLPPIKNPYIDNFIVELEEYIPHLRKAKFQGGEPFLIDVYYKIWEKIIELNPKCVISVQTNGSVLNEKIKSLLLKGRFHMTVSLDAVSKEIFDVIRLHGNFQKTMDNIDYFRAYCKKNNTYFGVATCPMQQNWHEIPEIIKLCNDLDAEINFNRVWDPPECALWNCSSEKLTEIYNFYSDYDFLASSDREYHNKKQFEELKEQVKIWSVKQKNREEQQKAFVQFDTLELKGQLIERVVNFMEQDSIKYNDEIKKSVMSKVKNILTQFENEEQFRSMLIKLFEIPEQVFVTEFKKNSEEILLLQAKKYLQDSF